MSNEPDKIIYSMIRVSKRHGQKEVLKDISLRTSTGPRSAFWASTARASPAC